MIFNKADILIPYGIDLAKWSVVACDQYTMQPEYWQQAKEFVGVAPSALNIIFPEAYLEKCDTQERIKSINQKMREYSAILKEYPGSLVYLERTLSEGVMRKGIVGAVDLSQYDYTPGSTLPIRATEGTVISRIPPRVKIRKDASLESPHSMLLMDDPQDTVFSSIVKGQMLYDFDLMLGGGHVTGYLIDNADEILDMLAKRETGDIVYAVGDGNHSLATAKACVDDNNPLTKMALTELVNIYDQSLEFRPIHRIIQNCNTHQVVEQLSALPGGDQKITILWENSSKDVYVKDLAVDTVSQFLDSNDFNVDYIHGEDVVERLASTAGNVGILLPEIDKKELFPSVSKNGALPRKTFSMGEACDKRFYLECRRLA